MDHSYSIDTCLYSSDGGTREFGTFDELNNMDEGDKSFEKQVENELGIMVSRECSSYHNEDNKPNIWKRCIQNFSKFRVSDKLIFIKDYLIGRNQFEYSLSSSTESSSIETHKSIDEYNQSQSETSDFEVMESSDAKETFSEMVSTKDVSDDLNLMDAPSLDLPSMDIDPEMLEKACVLFVDRTDALAKKALCDNQQIFADKLICNVFKVLNEVYDGDFDHDYEDSLDSQGIHPLFNLSFNLPQKTPEKVRAKLEEMSKEKVYENCLAEKIFVFDLLKRFRLKELTQVLKTYRQPLIEELWSLCLDTVVSNNHHDLDSLFLCRNNIRNENRNEENLEYREMPSIQPYSLKETPISSTLESENTQINLEVNDSFVLNKDSELNTKRTTSQIDSGRMSLCESGRSEKGNRERGSGRQRKRDKMYMGSNEALNYILKTNRFLNYDRVELLKGHFNLKQEKGSGGWIEEPHNRLQTFYLVEKNCLSIKVRGKVPCDIITALTIITETQLGPEWVPFLKKSEDLHSFSRTSRIFKQVFDYPMIGHKESLVYGLSTNVLDEANCVIISCSNPPSNKKDADSLVSILNKGGLQDTNNFISVDGSNNCRLSGYSVNKINKRQNQKSGDICFILFPYSEKQTIMEVYGSVVPEVKLVPMKFVSFLVKKVILGMFKKISNISGNFNESRFSESIKQRSDFYGWMDSIYQDYKLHNPQTFKYDQILTIYTYHPSIETKHFN